MVCEEVIPYIMQRPDFLVACRLDDLTGQPRKTSMACSGSTRYLRGSRTKEVGRSAYFTGIYNSKLQSSIWAH